MKYLLLEITSLGNIVHTISLPDYNEIETNGATGNYLVVLWIQSFHMHPNPADILGLIVLVNTRDY